MRKKKRTEGNFTCFLINKNPKPSAIVNKIGPINRINRER